MKKIISILALVLAMTMLMSVAAFAAPEFSVAEEDIDAKITALEAGADRIDLTAVTTPDADYSILLVKGDSLPTVDSDIAYINQIKAEAATTDFDVLPLIANCDEEMMLYIGTNATGENLISVPVSYAETAPAGPNVIFMDGAATVATVAAANGVAVAPAGPATVPTPAADALIDRYEFVGWTDADGTTTYAADDSIAVAAETTLYAKYKMYVDDTVELLYGDTSRDGQLKKADANHMVYYFSNQSKCNYVDDIGKSIDSANTTLIFGDLSGDGQLKKADANHLKYYFSNQSKCNYVDIVGTPIYFINK